MEVNFGEEIRRSGTRFSQRFFVWVGQAELGEKPRNSLFFTGARGNA
jgi:hypothetical protein